MERIDIGDIDINRHASFAVRRELSCRLLEKAQTVTFEFNISIVALAKRQLESEHVAEEFKCLT